MYEGRTNIYTIVIICNPAIICCNFFDELLKTSRFYCIIIIEVTNLPARRMNKNVSRFPLYVFHHGKITSHMNFSERIRRGKTAKKDMFSVYGRRMRKKFPSLGISTIGIPMQIKWSDCWTGKRLKRLSLP